jgi:hypothetical protein
MWNRLAQLVWKQPMKWDFPGPIRKIAASSANEMRVSRTNQNASPAWSCWRSFLSRKSYWEEKECWVLFSAFKFYRFSVQQGAYLLSYVIVMEVMMYKMWCSCFYELSAVICSNYSAFYWTIGGNCILNLAIGSESMKKVASCLLNT